MKRSLSFPGVAAFGGSLLLGILLIVLGRDRFIRGYEVQNKSSTDVIATQFAEQRFLAPSEISAEGKGSPVADRLLVKHCTGKKEYRTIRKQASEDSNPLPGLDSEGQGGLTRDAEDESDAQLSPLDAVVEQTEGLIQLTPLERSQIRAMYQREMEGALALRHSGKSIGELGLRVQGEYGSLEEILDKTRYEEYLRNKAELDAAQEEAGRKADLSFFKMILALSPDQEGEMDRILGNIAPLKGDQDPELNAPIIALPDDYTFEDYVARVRDLHSKYSEAFLSAARKVLDTEQLNRLASHLELQTPAFPDSGAVPAVGQELAQSQDGAHRYSLVGKAKPTLLE